MRVRDLLKECITLLLSEIDISDVSELCYADGSTHVMQTCKIGDDKFYLKFSDVDLFEDDEDPSMQILSEYLAYRIYQAYGVNIPQKIHLVFDQKEKAVGLATSPVPGRQGFMGFDPQKLAQMMSKGIYVDVLLANWDVIGGGGNVFIHRDDVWRIDPGGAFDWRAQSGKKPFTSKVGELETMMSPGFDSGDVYQYADLKQAADFFKSVNWGTVQSVIQDVDSEVTEKLQQYQFDNILKQWKKTVGHIGPTLKERHSEIAKHINWMEDQK